MNEVLKNIAKEIIEDSKCERNYKARYGNVLSIGFSTKPQNNMDQIRSSSDSVLSDKVRVLTFDASLFNLALTVC